MDGESTNSQDARIEELFRALDVKNKGHLDIDNLRAGLKRIDHRMSTALYFVAGISLIVIICKALKNASVLVEKILQNIDANNDNRISYEGPHLDCTSVSWN
jgi:solute carrier family 25 (mitochondrial phosphate transporter), member 23/24/25/41